jgi:hypothetical protein
MKGEAILRNGSTLQHQVHGAVMVACGDRHCELFRTTSSFRRVDDLTALDLDNKFGPMVTASPRARFATGWVPQARRWFFVAVIQIILRSGKKSTSAIWEFGGLCPISICTGP